MKEGSKVICTGGCHCGRVRYEVNIPEKLTASICNCSICSMTGFIHVIVDSADMRMLSGEDHIEEYRFHTGTAKHLFCRHCGVKSFYVPRSHPGGYSINLNCLEIVPGIEVEFTEFDGRHWRENIEKLRTELDRR